MGRRITRVAETLICCVVLLFGLGLLGSLVLDHHLAAHGLLAEATVVERWQSLAKSKQIVHHARVEFQHDGTTYRIRVGTPDDVNPRISVVFPSWCPGLGQAGSRRPDPPSASATVIKASLGLLFSGAAGLALVAALRRKGSPTSA